MQIEKILLRGAHFTAEQREVVQAIGRIDVVAGPGSGKTTVLAAKVLMLLSNRHAHDKGICCITHTNVAVKEILDRLKLGGVNEVDYPNFVGTIQSFMDKFLGKTAFATILPGITLKLLDDEKYSKRYEKNFRKILKNYSPNYNVPKPSGHGTELKIADNKSFQYTNTASHKYYSNAINSACCRLLKNGFASYSDLKSLSYWYLSKHQDELSKAFAERFSYLMLDEAQDTDDIQLKIINSLAEAKQLNVQRFGDPYQALYTIYGPNREDAWQPHPDNKSYNTKEISETTRFGSSIADLVKHVCPQEYDHFRSNQKSDPFPKYFMTYKNGDELKEKHTRLIRHAIKSSSDFSSSPKTDAIVGVMHQDLEKVEPTFSKEGAKQRTHIRSVSEIYALLLNLLANSNSISVREELQLIRKNHKDNLELADIIQELASQKISSDYLFSCLKNLLITETISEDDFKKNCDRLIQDITYLTNEPRLASPSVHREFATIHAVKGETHRSTVLLLDSSVHRTYQSEEKDKTNNFFNIVFPYLLGNRPEFSKNPETAKLQKDCLKFAYVALSRPKYLVAVAIPTQDLDDEKKKCLLSHKWIESK